MSQIKKKFIQDNAIDGTKIQLLNGQNFRAVDSTGVDRDLFYFNASNEWQLAVMPKVGQDPQAANDLVRKSYLDTQISSEASARAAAISAEQTSRQQAISAEQTSRQTAVTSLQSAIAALNLNSLTDVEMSSLLSGDIMRYNGTLWVKESPSSQRTVSAAATAFLSNEPTYQLNGLIFKKSTKWVGQSFTLSSQQTVSGVGLYMTNGGANRNSVGKTVTVELYAGDTSTISYPGAGNVSSSPILATGTGVVQANGQVRVNFSSSYSASAGVYSFAVFSQNDDEVNIFSQSNSYAGGSRFTQDSGQWSTSFDSWDLPFQLYGAGTVGSAGGVIKSDANGYLDQSLLQYNVNFGSNKLSGVANGTASTDAVNKSQLDAEASARTAAISAEQTSRQTAVTSLQSAITTEQSARIVAVNDLDARLDAIQGSGEGSVAKAEQDAKDYADQQIAALVDSAPGVLNTLNELAQALNDDPSFATTVATNISNAQASMQAAVDAEETRAIAAEGTLQSNIDAEETRAIAAEGMLQSNIDAEETRAIAAEGMLQDELDDTQAGAGLGVDGSYSPHASSNYIKSADFTSASVSESLHGADKLLDAAIKSEVDARSEAVSDLYDAIGSLSVSTGGDVLAEQLARQQADISLQNAIDAEESARIVAVNDLDARLDAIQGSGEGSVAKAEQDAKDYADQQIAALVDSAPELLNTLNELAQALGDDPSFATTVTNSIATAQTSMQAAVDAEETRAIAAEGTLQSAIDVLEAVTSEKEKIVLTSTNVTNGWIDLSHEAMAKSLLVMVDRLVIHEGDDYTLSVVGSVTRITFAGTLVQGEDEELVAGDVVRVMYRYQG